MKKIPKKYEVVIPSLIQTQENLGKTSDETERNLMRSRNIVTTGHRTVINHSNKVLKVGDEVQFMFQREKQHTFDEVTGNCSCVYGPEPGLNPNCPHHKRKFMEILEKTWKKRIEGKLEIKKKKRVLDEEVYRMWKEKPDFTLRMFMKGGKRSVKIGTLVIILTPSEMVYKMFYKGGIQYLRDIAQIRIEKRKIKEGEGLI